MQTKEGVSLTPLPKAQGNINYVMFFKNFLANAKKKELFFGPGETVGVFSMI